jgi:predicted DNA-binding protein (MmcQ/YjbR family)
MVKQVRQLTPPARAALRRLRTAAAALAGVEETRSFGNPTFKVDHRTFAVIDRYSDRDCLWLRVEAADRERMLKLRGWFPSPYDPRRTALCCALEQFDWRRLSPLLRASYRLALAA